MVWRIAFAAFLTACLAVLGLQAPHAQFNGCSAGFCGGVAGGAAYVGPGDVVSGALAWWGLQAYSLAKAGTKSANICNSSDANCADVSTLANGKFNVSAAQAAPLNCGGAGGTCTIKTLYDQTGALSCFGTACDVAQSTIASRPTLTFNCSGTNPCMSCSGSYLVGTGGFPSTAQPITWSIIVKRTTVNNFDTIINTSGGGNDYVQFANSANTIRLFGGSSLSATAADNLFHGIQGVFNGASSDLNIDGTSNTGNAGSGAISTFFQICADPGNPITGNIEEAGVWGIAFSGANSTAVSANQRSRFNF